MAQLVQWAMSALQVRPVKTANVWVKIASIHLAFAAWAKIVIPRPGVVRWEAILRALTAPTALRVSIAIHLPTSACRAAEIIMTARWVPSATRITNAFSNPVDIVDLVRPMLIVQVVSAADCFRKSVNKGANQQVTVHSIRMPPVLSSSAVAHK